MGSVVSYPSPRSRGGAQWSDSTGTTILTPDGHSIPIAPPESAPLPLLMRAWAALPFEARSRIITNGGMPGAPKLLNMRDAVVPNGTDATALTTAIAAAAALATNGQPGIVMVREAMTIATNVTVSSEVAVVSDNGASISGAGTLLISSYSELRGLALAVRVQYASTQTSKARVLGCKLSYSGQQIYDPGASGNVPHAFTKILWNEFVGGVGCYGVYYTHLTRAEIRFNWYHAAIGEGRGIFGLNLDRSLVEFNHIDGAIVGIGMLFDRATARRCNDTAIRRNLVENISEEGISVDCYGNTPAKMSCVDRLVVGSTTGSASSNPSIVCPRTTPNETTGILSGVFVVVLTGAAKGLVLRTVYIVASGTGNVRLQFANGSVTTAQLAAMVGENVSIQYLAERWVIEENYMRNCTSSIVSWGMLCNSEITRNIIDDPAGTSETIFVASLGGLNPSSTIMAADGCFSISCGVTVASNLIINNSTGAQIVYEGRSYGAEANTTPYIAALPSLCGDNSEDAAILPWNNTTTPWTSTTDPAVLSSIGAANPDVDVFRTISGDFTGTDAMLSGESSGVSRFNGTGAAVAFTIPHGLEVTPKRVMWNAMSTDARGDAAATVDVTNITLTFGTAPASGTNNVVVSWSAEA